MAKFLVRVSDNGTITLPGPLRLRLGIGPGTQISIHEEGEATIVLRSVGTVDDTEQARDLAEADRLYAEYQAGGLADWVEVEGDDAEYMRQAVESFKRGFARRRDRL